MSSFHTRIDCVLWSSGHSPDTSFFGCGLARYGMYWMINNIKKEGASKGKMTAPPPNSNEGYRSFDTDADVRSTLPVWGVHATPPDSVLPFGRWCRRGRGERLLTGMFMLGWGIFSMYVDLRKVYWWGGGVFLGVLENVGKLVWLYFVVFGPC